MSEFDDPQLERLLGGAGGAFPDVNTAYSQVRGRVRVIRRRRAMVAGTAACVLMVGGAIFAAQGGTSRDNLSPATDDLTTTAPSTTDTTLVTDTTPEDSNGQHGGTTDTGGTGVSTTSTATTTTVAAAPQTATYTSIGGSVTVRLQNGALSLVSATPAAGFTIDSSTSRADRVEVRFRNDDHDSRIRIDLVAGLMVDQIIEN